MEQSSIGSKPDFIDDGGLEVHKHGPGHVLAGPGLGEEGVEGVITATGCLIRWHGAIRLDAWQYWLSIKKPLILSNFSYYRVQDSKVPSRHFQSGSQPGQRGQKYTLSE